MMTMGCLLSCTHFRLEGSLAVHIENGINYIGLNVKRKSSHVSQTGFLGVVIALAKDESKKRMTREEHTVKNARLRKKNVLINKNRNEMDSITKPTSLHPKDELGMVEMDAASHAPDKVDQCSLHTPRRDVVLKSCIVTSGIFGTIALTIRQVSHIASEGGLPFSDCTVAMPYAGNFEWQQAEMIAGLVVLISSCRQLLLNFWPEFSQSSKMANQQILGSLEIWDYIAVSFLPGISEELLFRGALLPLIGLDWKGVTAAGIIFGVLHLGAGRKSAFAFWASFVGILYGFAAISSSSLIVPMASHSLNNLVGGLLWRYVWGMRAWNTLKFWNSTIFSSDYDAYTIGSCDWF